MCYHRRMGLTYRRKLEKNCCRVAVICLPNSRGSYPFPSNTRWFNCNSASSPSSLKKSRSLSTSESRTSYAAIMFRRTVSLKSSRRHFSIALMVEKCCCTSRNSSSMRPRCKRHRFTCYFFIRACQKWRFNVVNRILVVVQHMMRVCFFDLWIFREALV